MASPQKERGYVGIANDLWDEIICRDFTKRQKDILQFILRLSYGCNQKSAFVPLLKNFALCGVQANKIRIELERLEQCNVIFWNRVGNEFRFNKNYDLWEIKNVKKWDLKLYKGLIHSNLINSKKARTEVPKMGSEQEQEDFPKREHEVPEKGSEEFEKFPKREVEVTEKGSSTPDEVNQGAASEGSKKGLKKEVIKEILYKELHVAIITYLNEKTGKKFSPKTKNTIESINGRLTDGYTLDDFKYVIDVKTEEWLNDPKNNQYLCPDTLFRPSKFEKYRNQQMRSQGTGQKSHESQPKKEISDDEAMEIMRREGMI